MRKITKFCLLILSLVCLVCFSVGCDEHVHTPGSEYGSDGTSHWQTCECGEKVGVTEHSWDDGVVTTQPTHTAEGVKTFTCTVCQKTKTQAVAQTAHEFNTYKVVDGGHYSACSCGQTTGGVVAHSYTNYVCVCGHTDAKTFEDTVYLKGVNNFSYTADFQGNKTYTVDGATHVAPYNTQTMLKTTQNNGYQASQSMLGADLWMVSQMGGGLPPLNSLAPSRYTGWENYYSIEHGAEYYFSRQDTPLGTLWKKSLYSDVSNMTFSAEKYSGLSVFESAIKKVNQFTFDATSGTLKNTAPFAVTVVDTTLDPHNKKTTYTLSDMMFEFKIVDGKIEWMSLTATETTEFEYDLEANVWFYKDGLRIGKASKQVMTGTLAVKYENIGTTQINDMPTNYFLDPDMSSYWCDHSQLAQMEQQEYIHLQKCNNCNETVLMAMHDFNNGTCNDCGYVCLHTTLIDGSCSRVDDEKHSAYCSNCMELVEEDHDYDQNDHCADCGYTLCAHVNVTYQRNDNQTHSGWCQDCQNQIFKAHDFSAGVCPMCQTSYCEHPDIASVQYQTNSREHFKFCPSCNDRIAEEHNFESEVCTVCTYAVCHHTTVTSFIIEEIAHTFYCPECNENVYELHTLSDGVCTVCGFDENCSHSNASLTSIDAGRHANVCADCGYIVGGMQPHAYQGGACTGCNYACTHAYAQVVYGNPEYQADAQGHYVYCDRCQSTFKTQHNPGNYQNQGDEHVKTCNDCYYEIDRSTHSWQDGQCSDCLEVCQHFTWEEGVCLTCSYACTHPSFDEWALSDDDTKHVHRCTVCFIEQYQDHVSSSDEYSYKGVWTHSKICDVCNQTYAAQNHTDNGNGVCSICTLVLGCPHQNITGVSQGNVCKVTCGDCGMQDLRGHNFNQEYVCEHCSYACPHENKYCEEDGAGTHSAHCNDCGRIWQENCTQMQGYEVHVDCHKVLCNYCRQVLVTTAHEQSEDCVVCGYSGNCLHENTYLNSSINGKHCVICSDCYAIKEVVNHEYVNGVCACGDNCSHHDTSVYQYSEFNDGYHNVTCGDCQLQWQDTHVSGDWESVSDTEHCQKCTLCNKVMASEEHEFYEGQCVDCNKSETTGE